MILVSIKIMQKIKISKEENEWVKGDAILVQFFPFLNI
jgi:hypothetical protein